MGRPTKIEGNPEHPGSLGGTDVFAQAATLGMYDPDRSQTVMHDGRISDWGAFVSGDGQCEIATAARRRGVADSDRNGDVADAGGADSSSCWSSFRKRSGTSTSRAGATMRAKARAWRSASR